MCEIVDIVGFLREKNARHIPRLPNKLPPDQRGPNCGFYALSFVMNYWHAASEDTKETTRYRAGEREPLPARENPDPKNVRTLALRLGDASSEASDQKRQAKQEDLKKGIFRSLRQYGKEKQLTVIGSIFDAGNLVAVAKGAGAQYGGQFDGKAISSSEPDDFKAKVKNLIENEVPVLIPYDSEGGQCGLPSTNYAGKQAHWAVIFGFFSQESKDYAIYFTYGRYAFAELDKFAQSNAQLTTNDVRDFAKVELEEDGIVEARDYREINKEVSAEYKRMEDPPKSHVRIGPTVRNLEYNDPASLGSSAQDFSSSSSSSASSSSVVDIRNRIDVGGLRSRIVAVWRAEDRESLVEELPWLA